ncbi:WG repeat-containing protein [Massilia frigida]|nr:WG repeat-containing protein [Massilia frigida]
MIRPTDEWNELLVLHDGQVHVASPGLLQVFGPFLDDGAGGTIAAAMAVNGMYGYLNAKGEWVVAPTLEYAFPFSEGLSHFCEDGSWGYRNLGGKAVIPAQFMRVEPFRQGLAAVQVGRNKWRYIDMSGQFAFDASFGHANSFSVVGLAAARGTSSKYGYIDRTGAWAIAPRFALPYAFAPAGVAPATEENDKYGLIDQQGKWVLEPSYEQIHDFNDDNLAFCRESYNHEGYLDTHGVLLIRDMDRLSQTMQCAIAVDSHRTCMTAQGELAFDASLDWCDQFNADGFAVAHLRGATQAPAWGIARTDGTFVPTPADVIEPLRVQHAHVVPSEANTPLVAFLASDTRFARPDGAPPARSIVLIDRDAHIAYRWYSEPCPEGKYAALYDGAGQLLWKGAPSAVLHAPLFFFSASADSLLTELGKFDELTGLAESMVQAAEARLHAIDGLLQALESGEDEENPVYENLPGDFEEYDDDLDIGERLAKSMRTRHRIFRSYLDEDENARYEFLAAERQALMEAMHARSVARLTEHFGLPARDPDYAGEAATPDTIAWCIQLDQALAGPESNQLWLGLSTQVGYGDGDVWHHIWLVCAPSKETLEAAMGGRTLAHHGSDEDDSDPAPGAGNDWLARVRASPDTIVTMPEELIDDAIADAAIESDIRAYPFLPPRLQTAARLEALIRRDASTASSIPPVAMSADGLALARSLYADNPEWKYYDARNSAIQQELDHECLDHIWGCLLDEKTCETALFNDADIRQVPWWLHSEKIVGMALAANINNVYFIARSAITPELAEYVASRGNAKLMARIPPALLTGELCLRAVLKNEDAFSAVPAALREAVVHALIARDPEAADGTGSRWHALRAWTHLANGDPDAAIADAQRALGHTDAPVHMHFVLASAWRGKSDLQRAALEAAKVLSLWSDYVPPFDPDADIAWLNTLAQGATSQADDATLLEELASQPQLLATIPGRRITRAMVDLAVGVDAQAVRFVPRRLMTTALYELAFREGCKQFEQLPPSVMSEAFCLSAVNAQDYQLKHVPPELRTLALCIASVRERSWVMDDVPAPLREAVRDALAKPSA